MSWVIKTVFLLFVFWVFVLMATEAVSQVQMPKEYDPQQIATIIARLQARIQGLENTPSNIIVSSFQPRGKQVKIWFRPHKQDLYFYLGNAWRQVNFDDDTIGVATVPSQIPVERIEAGQVGGTEFDYLDGVTSDIQTQIDAKINVADSSDYMTNTVAGWGISGSRSGGTITVLGDSSEVATQDDVGQKADSGDVAHLAQAETITGNWVNTDNPWADNEVADAITVTGYQEDSDTTLWDATKTDVFQLCSFIGVRGNNFDASGWQQVPGAGNMGGTLSYCMTHAGSIIAISWAFNVLAETTAGDVNMKSLIGVADKLTQTDAISGVGDYSGYATVAAGTHTFSAGDILGMQIGFIDFEGTLRKSHINVIVQYDI